MNVFFLDYRYFREDAWAYVVDVLKIKKVYSFVETSNFMPSFLEKVLMFVKTNKEDFKTKIAYDIANTTKKPLYTPDGDFLGFDDLDLYKSSKCNSPENNILKTDDPNILILGKISRSTDGYSKTPCFEKYTSSSRDVGCEIASHTLNILKKQLQSDKYKERFCFWLMDIITVTDYNTTGKQWGSRPTILYFMSMELHKKYPDVFQYVKDKYTNNYVISNLFSDNYYKDRDKWQQEYEKERKYADEYASFEESLNSGVSWEDEVREMNEQFWNECGDAIDEM